MTAHNQYKFQRKRYRVGRRCVLDDTSTSSRPNELPGIPGVIVKGPYTEHGDTFIHIAIEQEVMGTHSLYHDQDWPESIYYHKIFEVRVPLHRVTPK